MSFVIAILEGLKIRSNTFEWKSYFQYLAKYIYFSKFFQIPVRLCGQKITLFSINAFYNNCFFTNIDFTLLLKASLKNHSFNCTIKSGYKRKIWSKANPPLYPRFPLGFIQQKNGLAQQSKLLYIKIFLYLSCPISRFHCISCSIIPFLQCN